MCVTRNGEFIETQKEHTYTVDGLINGGGDSYPVGLISVIIYSLVNGWAYNGGGGGALKWNFTVYEDLKRVERVSEQSYCP